MEAARFKGNRICHALVTVKFLLEFEVAFGYEVTRTTTPNKSCQSIPGRMVAAIAVNVRRARPSFSAPLKTKPTCVHFLRGILNIRSMKMRKIATPLLMAGTLLFSVTFAVAQPGPPNSCPLHITSCGCVITTTGTYEVDDYLNADQTSAPNCIEIAASHTVFNLKGFEITGNGTGIGILIRRSADHTVVQGGDEGAGPDGPGRIINSRYQPGGGGGGQGSILMWNIAIEDDADYAMIELFAQLGGNPLNEGAGNNTGLFLNGVRGTVAADFDASYNHVAGVTVKNSSGVGLHNFSATGSDPDGNIQPIGVMFDSTNDSTVATAAMAANHVYGLWLARSSRNVVFDANGTSGNQDTGILIGCGSLHCTGNQGSNDNKITNGGAPGNTNYGIVIEKHNSNNTITVTHNDGNGTTDMVDLNNHCDSNIWYNNTGTSNQSCIH